ncbi:MAG: gliding motility-associated C-terminal domain-containing protein, partial [Bacteroidetes bacterium]|nr:gliding motility-associated C-terminal domain-containing protein [Bacteroidota bacterium]
GFVFPQFINLVPNPSFEEYTNCPMNQGEIYFAKGWFNGCWYNPDYYNACANVSNITFGTPINQANNFQIPKTGVAYAGIHIYSLVPNLREYIAVKIIDKLIKDRKYCAKFYTSFGATSHAVDLIGAYFSLDSLICNNGNLFNKAPQICNPYGNLLIDTLNWMKISGSFISAGGEQYMYIGDFYPDSQNTIFPFNLSFPNIISYYYIDDVSVCECENLKPKFNKDTTLCFGQQLLLKANIPKEVDSVNYTWQDSSKNSTFLVTQPGTYWVSAYIEDYKITVCDSITVNYADCTSPTLWIPNSFTPNGDGLNDKFEYANAENYIIKTYIYNRWGQMVFEGQNTNFWDGTFKGKIVPLGVYAYTIEAMDKRSNEKKVYSGRVTVVQ